MSLATNNKITFTSMILYESKHILPSKYRLLIQDDKSRLFITYQGSLCPVLLLVNTHFYEELRKNQIFTNAIKNKRNIELLADHIGQKPKILEDIEKNYSQHGYKFFHNGNQIYNNDFKYQLNKMRIFFLRKGGKLSVTSHMEPMKPMSGINLF